MNSYWKYTLYPRFLDEIKRDCTFIDMDDLDLRNTLAHLVLSAIQDFPFCKVSLEYAEDTGYDSLDGGTYGYYFVSEDVGEAEYKVLLSLMKYYWMFMQISDDSLFRNPFFDKDIKGYSPGNLLNAMRSLLEVYRQQADRAKFNYNRINKDGKIAWGNINGNKH